MIITVELSIYPFDPDYRELIQDFINKLKSESDIRIMTSPTSTTVIGEYKRVMQCINDMILWSYDEQGRSALVAKFIPGYDGQ